ncbi:MAG: hypothetical protein K0R16_1903 [Nitrososphaeraceae archaeon]|jgi:hypothetical protein|nr:hypothetical protein [Nitrososphaeraceae archaeon]MDF2767780.1 hypothetical protein [Nitrososphaeraceae archaeon]
MEGIGLGSLVAGQGYIPVLFFQLTLFSAEKWGPVVCEPNLT